MSIETRLPEAIRSHLEQLEAPLPDLGAVTKRGRRLQQRRTVALAALALAVVAGAGIGLLRTEPGGGRDNGFEPVGPLDYSHGLRVLASPDSGGWITIGGKKFHQDGLGELDVAASATPYGVVYFDSAQRANLLREDGTAVALAPAPSSRSGTHPTSKFDAEQPLVAWTELGGGSALVRVYDLEDGSMAATLDVPCGGSCDEVAVDAFDQGLVFVRTSEGTFVWDPDSGQDLSRIAGPQTRIADVRNKVVLYDGPSPTTAGPVDGSWTFAKGAIDAQLTFDGGHAVAWSTTLEPTHPGDAPIKLDVKQVTFFSIDTDGSVLAASYPSTGVSTLYDCEVPSGTCAKVAKLSMASGDPVFMGNDM